MFKKHTGSDGTAASRSQAERRIEAELSDDELEHVAGGATVDYFLKLDGIDGESTDDQQKNEIDAAVSTSATSPRYSDITLKKGYIATS